MEPVLIIMDVDGYLISAGDPKAMKPKKMAEYLRAGHKAETITIDQYRAKEWKWIWDKPKTVQPC